MNPKLCQKSLTKMRLRYGNRMFPMKPTVQCRAKLLGTAIVIVQGPHAILDAQSHREVRLTGGGVRVEQPWRSRGSQQKCETPQSAAATSARHGRAMGGDHDVDGHQD
jgi:hypothetical protein